MQFNEAVNIVKEAKICDESDLAFQAAVIILIGADHDWDLDELYRVTNFGYEDVHTILSNLLENEVIVDGKIEMEYDAENPLSQVIEFTLLAMLASGQVVRTRTNKPEYNMPTKKTLNDHLFEQLERLSACDSETIDLEANKAVHIIQVADKILDVAKLKLEIIGVNKELINEFSEIDTHNGIPQIENKPPQEKKQVKAKEEMFVHEDFPEEPELEDIEPSEEDITPQDDDIDDGCYPGTLIKRKPIPTDEHGNLLTEEKRGKKLPTSKW